MREYKPVSVSKGSFAFCRYSVAVVLWASIIFQSKELVLFCFVTLLFSFLLKVQRAPFILIFDHTIERFHRYERVLVDENGIRFAHFVGAFFSGLCCLFLYFNLVYPGWIMTVLLAILKTSAAFGFCSALKLYTCMTGGNCCRVGRFLRRKKSV